MGRYDDQADSTVTLDGDKAFLGVDANTSPTTLEPGMVAAAVNKIFDSGEAITRPAFSTTDWASSWAVDFPIDFPFDFYRSGFGTTYGLAVFSDPYRQEAMLVAVETGVWRVGESITPELIGLPTGVSLDGPVQMVQAFDRVLMFRGPGKSTLLWNPAQDQSLGLGSFEEVPDETNVDYTSTIPETSDGTVFLNRLWAPFGRDLVAVSDILAYTRWDTVINTLRVNSGTDDEIVRIFPYNQQSLLVFKSRSIYLLSGLSGDDLLSTVSQDILTPSLGAVSRNAIVQVGNDVWFLSSARSINSVGQVLENSIKAAANPVSEAIQPIMDRINWGYASAAAATTDGRRAYFAVPLDGATHNNAILVYNIINSVWEGYWEADFLDVLQFARSRYAGELAIFWIQGTTAGEALARGSLFHLSKLWEDMLYSNPQPIPDMITTRGYLLEDMDGKKGVRLQLLQRTWNPSYTVTAIAHDGSEVVLVADQTKDRTVYYQFGVTPYVTTNVNDDHGTEGREDYSVVTQEGTLVLVPGSNGLDIGRHVTKVERFDIRRPLGVFFQLRMESGQGRVIQKSITLEGVASSRGYRRS